MPPAPRTSRDARSWSLGGQIAFKKVTSGGDFTLWLASAADVPSFGSPCDSAYSCRSGPNVVINETRWQHASPSWRNAGASLANYRHMVVNHEVGHWLGFQHEFCTGAGQLAPVMQQQSISMQGCRPNPWPTASERSTLGRRLGVAVHSAHDPVGRITEAASPARSAVRLGGATFDRDAASRALTVHLTRDGAPVGNDRAAAASPSFDAYYGIGGAHRFAVRLSGQPAGRHRYCAAAVNVGAGKNRTVACATITVRG